MVSSFLNYRKIFTLPIISVLDYAKQLAVFDKEFGVKGKNSVIIMKKYIIT